MRERERERERQKQREKERDRDRDKESHVCRGELKRLRQLSRNEIASGHQENSVETEADSIN